MQIIDNSNNDKNPDLMRNKKAHNGMSQASVVSHQTILYDAANGVSNVQKPYHNTSQVVEPTSNGDLDNINLKEYQASITNNRATPTRSKTLEAQRSEHRQAASPPMKDHQY